MLLTRNDRKAIRDVYEAAARARTRTDNAALDLMWGNLRATLADIDPSVTVPLPDLEPLDV